MRQEHNFSPDNNTVTEVWRSQDLTVHDLKFTLLVYENHLGDCRIMVEIPLGRDMDRTLAIETAERLGGRVDRDR